MRINLLMKLASFLTVHHQLLLLNVPIDKNICKIYKNFKSESSPCLLYKTS